MNFRFLPALAVTLTLAAAQDAAFPPLKSPGDIAGRGAAIQHTMTLLNSSAVEKKNRVRILFYGQSITEQDWWRAVHRDLIARFPQATLEVENRAIGGHAAQLLEKTAEADLYPWQPDLVIFHVYGAHDSYERIIRRIRERTTAEVLMQTDHPGAKDKLDEPTDAAALKPDQWNPWMNYSFLPATAKKYGCELLPVRDMWKTYLRENNLEPRALLKDDVHLNDHGNFLMAEAVKTGLAYRPSDSPEAWSGLVKEVTLTEASWKGDALTVNFEGTRVDGIWGGTGGGTAAGGRASLRIDGKAPEEIRQLFTFTRATAFTGSNWPCLLRVQRGPAQLQEEEWTITLANASPDYKSFLFSLTGSKTGPDGVGSAGRKFVSKSGRIVIEPGDWNLQFAQRTFGRRLPEEFRITFRSLPQWDTLPLGTGTFVKGLTSGPHTIELSGPGIRRSGLTGLRIYKPPFPQTEDPAADKSAD
jgi:hypothetical protein